MTDPVLNGDQSGLQPAGDQTGDFDYPFTDPHG